MLKVERELFPVFPNPAQDQIMVSFTLNQNEPVKFSIYQMDGKLVNTPLEEKMHYMGMHRNTFDVSHLSNGIYILQMEAGSEKYQQRISIKR
jgi:hypothetical protein